MYSAEKIAVLRKRFFAFAALAALLASSACSRNKGQAAQAMPPPLVTVAKATAQNVQRDLDEIGQHIAFASVDVAPQVGARIVELHFQAGENLSKEQLLFIIDPQP